MDTQKNFTDVLALMITIGENKPTYRSWAVDKFTKDIRPIDFVSPALVDKYARIITEKDGNLWAEDLKDFGLVEGYGAKEYLFALEEDALAYTGVEPEPVPSTPMDILFQ